MENYKNIIPMGRLHGVIVDIEGASALVDFEVEIVDDSKPYTVLLGIDWTINMNEVINLKKLMMSLERKPLCILVPLDPPEGLRYTELVRDDKSDNDLG